MPDERTTFELDGCATAIGQLLVVLVVAAFAWVGVVLLVLWALS